MICSECGGTDFEVVKRPDSLQCVFPNEMLIDRCTNCGHTSSRTIKEAVELIAQFLEKEEDDGDNT